MKKILESIGLTGNEIKVYKALLTLKNGTKTPIVRESQVTPSKIYDLLDSLIQKGLVAYFEEDNVKHFIPVKPENLIEIFDEKIKQLESQKKKFSDEIKKYFTTEESQEEKVQVYKGWTGLKNVFQILLNDLNPKDTYRVLGSNPGENIEKAELIFPIIDKQFRSKNIARKVIFNLDSKEIAKTYFKKYGKQKWKIKYANLTTSLEIGITNNYVMLSLLEETPLVILIKNKKIRQSYLEQFENLWKLS